MQELITEFNTSLSSENLLLSWQKELVLRRRMRHDAGPELVRIENKDEFKFLQRSLYYGPGRDLFFEMLFRNMNSQTVLNCVLEAPRALISNFLSFLTRSILVSNASPGDWQFLINMYREEFRTEFTELINHMNAEQCAYLTARTGNHDLRRLLKRRQADIIDSSRPEKDLNTASQGIDIQADYPTMYGDKIKTMTAAIKALKDGQNFDLSVTPLNRGALKALLNGGDALFRAGLLSDCLVILTRIATSPDMDEQSLLLSGEHFYYQQIDGLLRKVLPIFSFLASPFDPHRYALELYRNLFPGFRPDTASLLYLDIQALVMASLQGHHRYANYELAQKAAKILALRPDDTVASTLLKSRTKLNSADVAVMEIAVGNRMPLYPHEAFTTMEIIRLWLREDRIKLGKSSAANLLNGYRQLYYWIPAAPFMNEQVLNQLGPVVDDETRTACEHIIAVMQETSQPGLNFKKPEGKTAGYEMTKLHRQLLLSKYMGVF